MRREKTPFPTSFYGGAAAALSYTQKVLNQFGANILSYLPLNDSSGSTAADASGNSRTGTIGGCTLGVTGMGDGETAISLPGTTGNYINWYTASLRDAFSGAAGSAMIWLKVAGAAVWTNAAYREAICLYIDGSNYILIGRPTDNYMCCMPLTELMEQAKPTGRSVALPPTGCMLRSPGARRANAPGFT